MAERSQAGRTPSTPQPFQVEEACLSPESPRFGRQIFWGLVRERGLRSGKCSGVVAQAVCDKPTLALLGGYDVNATRYLGHFLAVTLRAPYLRCLVLRDGFGALEGFAAFFTTILVSRHVRPPHRGSLLVGMAGRYTGSYLG